MKKKIIVLVGVAALIGGGALLLGNKSQRYAHEMGPSALPVVVDILALRDSMVSSRLSAYVTALPLFEGNRFKRGDLLVRLDMTPTRSQGQGNSLATELAAADSTLKAEQEKLRRAKVLYSIQGISQEQLQATEAASMAAYSRYTVAKENLRGATITAPFDGIVSQRLVQPGDLVTPGKPLLKITDSASGNRLLVNIPETIQPIGLSLGEKQLPLMPWPEAGPQGLRRYEARSQDGSLLPGTRIDAKLVIFRSTEAVLLSRECLLNDNGHSATVLAFKSRNGRTMTPPPDGAQGEHKPHTTEEIERIQVKLSAHGEEGSVAVDTTLSGRRIICGSPDILSRLVAGSPFVIQPAKD